MSIGNALETTAKGINALRNLVPLSANQGFRRNWKKILEDSLRKSKRELDPLVLKPKEPEPVSKGEVDSTSEPVSKGQIDGTSGPVSKGERYGFEVLLDVHASKDC